MSARAYRGICHRQRPAPYVRGVSTTEGRTLSERRAPWIHRWGDLKIEEVARWMSRGLAGVRTNKTARPSPSCPTNSAAPNIHSQQMAWEQANVVGQTGILRPRIFSAGQPMACYPSSAVSIHSGRRPTRRRLFFILPAFRMCPITTRDLVWYPASIAEAPRRLDLSNWIRASALARGMERHVALWVLSFRSITDGGTAAARGYDTTDWIPALREHFGLRQETGNGGYLMQPRTPTCVYSSSDLVAAGASRALCPMSAASPKPFAVGRRAVITMGILFATRKIRRHRRGKEIKALCFAPSRLDNINWVEGGTGARTSSRVPQSKK